MALTTALGQQIDGCSRTMLTARSAPTIVTAGDPGANAASFARHLRAANLTPKTQRTYLDALAAFARFLTDAGIPTEGAAIRREHVEAFIADQLARSRRRCSEGNLQRRRRRDGPLYSDLHRHPASDSTSAWGVGTD